MLVFADACLFAWQPVKLLLHSLDEEQVYWAAAMLLSLVGTPAVKANVAAAHVAQQLVEWAVKDIQSPVSIACGGRCSTPRVGRSPARQ